MRRVCRTSEYEDLSVWNGWSNNPVYTMRVFYPKDGTPYIVTQLGDPPPPTTQEIEQAYLINDLYGTLANYNQALQQWAENLKKSQIISSNTLRRALGIKEQDEAE